MLNLKSGYASYLLRLRRVQSDNLTTWIATIQTPATGEQRSFANVAALLDFLQAEFKECQPANEIYPQGAGEDHVGG